MNVTVLSFFFLPEYSGGARQWAGVMKSMKQQHDIHFNVIAARLNSAWPKSEIMDGIRVTRVRVRHSNDLVNFWLNASVQLWKTRSRTDLVQANGLKQAHGFPLWVAHRLGKPTLGRLSIADSDVSFSTQGRLLGRLHKWCLERVDKYVAISSALVKEVTEVGLSPEKCVQLFNGVDTDVYYPVPVEEKEVARASLGLGNETVVLFVGVLDHRKGVDVLIPAFRRVAEARQNVRLVLVGPANRDDREGSYVNQLKAITREFGISEAVNFRDYTEDIRQYYHAADLLALPSRKEGMPNVVLEAMACGLPVVGTSISGTEDLVVPGETGLLVSAGDETELARAMLELIDAPMKRLKMGESGFRAVKRRHTMGTIAESYIGLYRELLC